ncbi:uncharacterized protein [Onthophagus taurus]|uniref:uncharacterized protein n=1 Tax=Onthophagus taurus TaxID=166361 RepID=UPI0039BDF5BF
MEKDLDVDPYKKIEISEVFVLKESIEAITKLTNGLSEKIEQNTSRIIKDLIGRLQKQVDAINKRTIQEWIENHKYAEVEKMMHDSDIQTDPPKMVDMGTQTREVGTVEEFSITDKYSDWRLVADRSWTEDVYKNTENKEGNPNNTEDSTIKVMLVEPGDPAMEKGIQKLLKDRFPELAHVKDDIGFVEQTYRFGTKDNLRTGSRKIFKIVYDGSEEDLFNKIMALKNETENECSIATHIVEGVNLERLKKMFEGIFHNTKTKVTIYMPKNYLLQKQEKPQKERKTYALVIGNNEKTYKESLKTVKEALKNTKCSDVIKNIRSTKDGKVILTTEKNEKALSEMQKAIVHLQGENTSIKRIGEEVDTIHVRGMDAIVDKAEVIEAIEAALGKKNVIVRMSELRPMRNNTQAVTLTLKKMDASDLMNKGPVRIGYTSCNLEKRLNVMRCSRCWEYGHETWRCKGTDRAKLCYRCGKKDHIVADCKNEEACPLCEEEGHRAGSGKCKIFKKELASLRKKQQKELAKRSDDVMEVQVQNADLYEINENIECEDKQLSLQQSRLDN